MRVAVAIPLLLALAGSALAKETVGRDGFSICAWGKGALGPRKQITADSVREFGLTPAHEDVLLKLRRLAADPRPALLDEIARSFGAPRNFAEVGAYADRFYPEREPQAASCIECGLHLRFRNAELFQITYGRWQGGFQIIWNRALVAPAAK
jgi:hypothetical protein